MFGFAGIYYPTCIRIIPVKHGWKLLTAAGLSIALKLMLTLKF
jgi:hypothetical protein